MGKIDKSLPYGGGEDKLEDLKKFVKKNTRKKSNENSKSKNNIR